MTMQLRIVIGALILSGTFAAQATLLYDNGPLVTHPGGGSGGADASAVQTAFGLDTFGFGHADTSGFRVADDFIVPAGGWFIDDIFFFAYQTGSTTTSTINAVNFRIWDSTPGAAGSSVVFGDTSINRLLSSQWSNIYRVLDTSLTNAQRPVMTVTADANVLLAAGTYWLDWQVGGTLPSGPWAPPISILQQPVTGNGLQYDPNDGAGQWRALFEGQNSVLLQGLPFQLIGSANGTVPEPGTLALLGLGLAGLGFLRRRRT